MGVRKDVASLTAAEKARFVDAVKQLKADGRWDHHVMRHRTAMLDRRPDPAHAGPAFLPWHRECLRRLELELEQIDPRVSIPYWNWIRDRRGNAPVWANDFMGGNGVGNSREVRSGPFAHSTGEWTLTVNDTPDTPPFLRRAFGVARRSLPTGRQLRRTIRTRPYDRRPWNFRSDPRRSFRQSLELLHNQVHMWVGGTMTGATSPNDPIFYLHHCFIDRLWARWQARYPRERYLPRSGGPTGHNRHSRMWPWANEPDPPTPAKVWNYRNLGYRYAGDSRW